MIGSIAIGIVVDDTLHFMYNFRKYFDQTGDASFSIEKTMLGTGRALLLTSVILSAGFFILMSAFAFPACRIWLADGAHDYFCPCWRISSSTRPLMVLVTGQSPSAALAARACRAIEDPCAPQPATSLEINNED